MGGHISLASAVGAGSFFRFSVTFVPRTAQPLVRDQRVLVIDDNATCRTLLYRWCAAWGMSCDLVEDLASAQTHLATSDTAVVLVDAGRRPQQALDFARALTGDRRTARYGLVLLIPFGQQRLADEALAAGYDAWVDKPLRKAVVHQALTVALGAVHAQPPARSPGLTRRFSGRVLVAEDNAVNHDSTSKP